jgi:hypothetical protein
MSRVIGDVHCAPPGDAPFENGRAEVMVGCCKAYDGGPHVLLTVEQRGPCVLETALTPDAAEEIARKLLEAAAHMRRQQ